MLVQLVKPVAFRPVGRVLDVIDAVGEMWIARKQAVRHTPAESPVEHMVPPRQVDVAVSVQRGRGRPRGV
jgi:hypothetical protein